MLCCCLPQPYVSQPFVHAGHGAPQSPLGYWPHHLGSVYPSPSPPLRPHPLPPAPSLPGEVSVLDLSGSAPPAASQIPCLSQVPSVSSSGGLSDGPSTSSTSISLQVAPPSEADGGGGLTMALPQTRRELSSLSSSPSAGKPVNSFFARNVLRCVLKVKGPSLSMIKKTLASWEETARRVWRPCPFWTLSSWLLSEPSRGTRTLIRTTGPQCKAPRSPLTFFFFFFTPSMKELSMPPPLWAVITLNTILARRDILLAT